MRFLDETHPEDSKQKSSTKETQCVPLVGCKMKMSEFIEKSSSLI